MKLRLFLFLILFFSALPVFAVSQAEAWVACEGFVSSYKARYPSSPVYCAHHSSANRIQAINPSGTVYASYSYDDNSCPVGQVWNYDTHRCDPLPDPVCSITEYLDTSTTPHSCQPKKCPSNAPAGSFISLTTGLCELPPPCVVGADNPNYCAPQPDQQCDLASSDGVNYDLYICIKTTTPPPPPPPPADCSTTNTCPSGDGTSGTGTSGDGTSGTGTSGDGTSGTGTSGTGTSGTGTGCSAGDACDQSQIRTNTSTAATKLTDLVDGLNKKPTSGVSVWGSESGYKSLYTKKEKTISGVFQTFSSEISNAPLVSSVHSFFDVGSFGGSCPVWSVDAWFFHIVIDQLCSSLVIHEVFPIVRAVIILVFSFSAFRVAFL